MDLPLIIQRVDRIYRMVNGGKGSGRRPYGKSPYKKAPKGFFEQFAANRVFKGAFTKNEEKMIQEIRKSIRQGKKVDTIAVMKTNSKETPYSIIDGWHRMRAFYLEQRVPRMRLYKSKSHYYESRRK